MVQMKRYFVDMFKRLNQTEAYYSLFSSLWHSSLPCYDVKKVTANANGFRLTPGLFHKSYYGRNFNIYLMKISVRPGACTIKLFTAVIYGFL
jgi:hypothetical protein